MFSKKPRKPSAPLMMEPDFESTAEYEAEYNSAWEKFYAEQEAWEQSRSA